MNPEVLQKSFEYATSNGYTGTQDEFLNLLKTNEKALSMTVDYAVNAGLVKDKFGFESAIGLKKKEQSLSVSPSAAPSRGSMQAQAPVEKQPNGDSAGAELTPERYDFLYKVYGDDRQFNKAGAMGQVSEEEFTVFDAERKRRKAEVPVDPVAKYRVDEAKTTIQKKKLEDVYSSVPVSFTEPKVGQLSVGEKTEEVDMTDPAFQIAEKQIEAEKKDAAEFAKQRDLEQYSSIVSGFKQSDIQQVPEEKLYYAIKLAKGFSPGATTDEVLSILETAPDLIAKAPNTNEEFEAEFSTIRDDLFSVLNKAYSGDQNAKIQLAQYVESGSIVNAYNEYASKYNLDQISTLDDVVNQGLQIKNYESALKTMSALEDSKYEEGRKFAKESGQTAESIYKFLLDKGSGILGFGTWYYDATSAIVESVSDITGIEAIDEAAQARKNLADILGNKAKEYEQESQGIYAGQMEEIGLSLMDRSKSYIELINEGKGDLAAKKAGVDIANALPQIIENSVVTVATGGVGGMAYGAATGFVTTAGSAYSQVRGDEYLSLAEKSLYATIVGGIEAGVELVPVFRNAESVLLKSVKKEAVDTAKKTFLKKLADTPLSEGLEEAVVSLATRPVETAFESLSIDREIDGYSQQLRITTDEIRRQELQAQITDATVRKDMLKWVDAGEVFDSFVVGTGVGSGPYVLAKGYNAVGTFASAKERAAIRSKESALLDELAKTTDEARKAEIKKDIATLAESHNRLAMKDAIVYESMTEEEIKKISASNRTITAARQAAVQARTLFSGGKISAEERDARIEKIKTIVETEFNSKKEIESKYIREASKYDNKALDEEEIRVVKEVSSLDADIESFGQLSEGQESIEVTAENAEQVINGIVSSGKIRSTKYSTAEQITKGLRNVVSTVKSLAKSSPNAKVIVHGTKESMQKASGQASRGYWVNKNEQGQANEIHLYVPALKTNTAYHEAYHEAEFSQLKGGASQSLATAFASAQFDENTKEDLGSFVREQVRQLINKAEEANDNATVSKLQEALDSNDLGKMINADNTGVVADEFLTELKATIETGEATLDFKTSLAGKLKEFVSRNIFRTGVGNPKTRDVVSAINASVGSMRRGEAVSLAAEAKVTEGVKRTTQARTGKAQLGERTEPVTIEGSPKGVFLNIGLLEGMTNRVIPVSEILDKLPQGITVIEAKEVQGTEPTVSVQLSRKLTDAEMDKFLADTKQMAIPQLADGEGVIHGTTDWGPFDPKEFKMPDGRPLSDATKGGDSKRMGKLQIIGENAYLSQNVKDNLTVARNMENSGGNPKDIRMATGWERGADGKWRYEIDPAARLNLRLSPPIVELTNGNIADAHEGALEDLIRFDELFRLYPSLRRIPVDLYIGGIDGVQGALSVVKDGTPIYIQMFAKDKSTALSGMIHEIQHAIQQIEGFAIGGDLTTITNERRELTDEEKFDAYKRLAGETEARNAQERAKMSSADRRAKTLQETEDVAREEQIVIFQSGKAQPVIESLSEDVGIDAFLEESNYSKRQIEIERNRLSKNKPEKQTRVVDVVSALKDYTDGKITQQEYISIVRESSPIEIIKEVPAIPDVLSIAASLTSDKVEKGIIGYGKDIPDGYYVGSRLDIPAYESYDTWVVSLHQGKKGDDRTPYLGGKAIGYGQVASLKNVTFDSTPYAAYKIALGGNKQTIARIFGDYYNVNPKELRDLAVSIMSGDEYNIATEQKEVGVQKGWVQVGMNPFRHSWFYDKRDGLPVVAASEVIQIGSLVLAKDTEKISVEDERFTATIKEEGKPAVKIKFQTLEEITEDVRSRVSPGKNISTYYIEGDKRSSTGELIMSRESVRKADESFYIKTAQYISKIPIIEGALPSDLKNPKTLADADKVHDIFKEIVVGNLLYLHDKFPKDLRGIASLWYDGANILARQMADKYGIEFEKSAAILAAFSPQKDWFQNIRLAEVTMEALSNHSDYKIDQGMIDYAINVEENAFIEKIKKNKSITNEEADKITINGKKLASLDFTKEEIKNWAKSKKGEMNEKEIDKIVSWFNSTTKILKYKSEFSKLKNKKLGDVSNSSHHAVMLRAFIQTNPVNSPDLSMSYNIYSPDGEKIGLKRKKGKLNKKTGETIPGELSRAAFGSYSTISAAVSIFRYKAKDDQDLMEFISENTSKEHKVRNFTNNISDPGNKNAATIDTHAVGAALLMVVSGSHPIVGKTMGGMSSKKAGMSGIYYAFFDAYVEAAKKRGIDPRQMQSITWEAIRLLFEAEKKRSDLQRNEIIKETHDKFRTGKIGIEQARDDVFAAAEGIGEPDWAQRIRSRTSGTEQGGMADDTGVLGLDEPQRRRDQSDNVLRLKEETKSSSAKKSGKAQGDLDAYVADLMNKYIAVPGLKTITYKGRTILIDKKTLEYVKAGMAKPAIMKLLTEEVGMSKKEAEETYKRSKAYLAGNRQGKMGGAMKNASAGRIKSIQPPANPLKTYGQMQPGDRKGK